MIPEMVLNNLQSWMAQVFVIASIGVALPLLLRIRHPRSKLAYCHLLLLLCLVLPIMQPWKHEVVQIGRNEPVVANIVNAQPAVQNAVPATASWQQVVAWVIIAGFVARMCWIAFGLWTIRRHKVAAMPLHPLPESLRDARERTNAGAVFCLSPEGIGPVTFGFLQPVVLLPASFHNLSAEAQTGIACHELIHVRRRDWLVTLIEEIIAAVFWFHPAFWWLLSQARLAREQLVDAEVVRLTSARDPYIDALLTMAGARPALDLAPASLFLRKRHLLQRMQLLVTEVSMSKFRLVSSYAAMAVILALAGWIGFVSFPLTGLAEIKEEAAAPPIPEAAEPAQASPGYVVNIQPRTYPREAIDKKIEGQVVVELTFNAAGNIIDARVLSGPEELRKAALDSALQGSYSVNVARSLQVVVDFRLAALRTGRGGALAPPPPPPPPPPPARPPELKGTVESFDIRGFEEPGLSALRQRLQAFVGQEYSQEIGKQISEIANSEAAASPSPFHPFVSFYMPADSRIAVQINSRLEPGLVQTPFGVVSTSTVATPFGVLGGRGPTQLTPITKVDPVYPPLARQARIQGVVVLQVTVNPQGAVENLKVVTGHPLLIQAAIDAVKQWQYEKQADAVTTIATVNFTL